MRSRNSKTMKKTKLRGGCGCNKPAFFTGGVALGAASLPVSATTYPTNELNTHNTDPLAPDAQVASRMLPNPVAPFNPFSGGNKKSKKDKRNKRTKKRTQKRRVRGGNSSISNTLLYSAGSINGAPLGASIVAGKSLDVPADDQSVTKPPATLV